MEYVKGVTEFPSLVQKRIYITALQQTPLEVSLAKTDGIDPILIKSCRDYHSFIMSMLTDMYENSLEYGMNTGEYDSFLNGRKENGVKRKFPSKTLELRSKTFNCVNGYLKLLFEIGKAGECQNGQFVISVENYGKIKEMFDSSLNPKKKTITNDIPYQTRLDALKRVGLSVDENAGGAVITSDSFPGMFLAMSGLAKSSDTIKTFGAEGFFHCEFRQIWDRHTPDYADVFQMLPEKNHPFMDEINDYLRSKKARPSITTFWKVNYKYKGDQLCCLAMNDNVSEVRVTGAYFWNNQDLLFGRLEAQDEDFKKYLLRHLNYCTGCSTSHDGGYFIEILGQKKRLCGLIGMRVYQAAESDVPYIKKYIDIVIDMLNEKEGR